MNMRISNSIYCDVKIFSVVVTVFQHYHHIVFNGIGMSKYCHCIRVHVSFNICNLLYSL